VKTKKKKKRPIGKARKAATTRSTAGPGFDFEDKVAAWLLLHVLSGQSLPGVEGSAVRVQMQTEALGWLIDDILVTTAIASDDRHHLAISCKSNLQVSAAGLPRDFVERAWKQWSAGEAGPMRRGRDHLLLATGGRHPEFQATWSEIKRAASGPDSALALGRIRATPKQRRILQSITGPADNLRLAAGDDDILALIQTVDVMPVDFHLARSTDQNTAIAECRRLLVNGSAEEGKGLWEDLVARARNARLGHGTIEINDLWRDLRRRFQLKGLPDFSASWERLKAISADWRSRIESALPSGLVLERKEAAEGLEKLISGEGTFILHGESGTGKSALARAVLDGYSPDDQQVWLGPDEIAAALSEVERHRLGLAHPLLSVLDATPQARNVLVIDAAERLSRPLIPQVTSLLAELRARKTLDGTSGWRILIIGQTQAWVSGQLQNLSGVQLPSAFELKPLSERDVRLALRSTDQLGWLATHDDAVAALTNLRALGWVIEAAPRFEGQGSEAISSLTAIADRLWA
jgi:hypothetical protein